MPFAISGSPACGDLTFALAAGASTGCDEQDEQPSGAADAPGWRTGHVGRPPAGESLLISEYRAQRMAFVALSPACPGRVCTASSQGTDST